MATFKVETKNKVNIDKKPRVYFTCHPEDFEKHFKKVCKDIFKTHDCAIYYTEDMTEAIAEDEIQVDLGRNNLFVIPVTFKLLTTANRAMDEDIPYALKEHIPILPIMMEPGIDEFYSKPDKFGKLQYLNPYSTDPTEISYGEKLKKYLESVLISDELAKRVRAAFDAYIFLSYRKSDRQFLHKTMDTIHSNALLRDVAIWYDEFLVPGENFENQITEKINQSVLVAMIVTPKILQKKNYVLKKEYPLAVKLNKSLFAFEFKKVCKVRFKYKYPNIKNIVNINNITLVNNMINDITQEIGIKSTNNTPEHMYLIGLAYLNGIDVECNATKAMDLFVSAANAGHIASCKQLILLYRNRTRDISKSFLWQEKLIALLEEKHKKESSFQNAIELLDEINVYLENIRLENISDQLPFFIHFLSKNKIQTNYKQKAAIYQPKIMYLLDFLSHKAASVDEIVHLCKSILIIGAHFKKETYDLYAEILKHIEKLADSKNFTKNDSQILNDFFFSKLINFYWKTYKYIEASKLIEYYKRIIQITNKFNYSTNIIYNECLVLCNEYIGTVFENENDYQEAYSYFKKAFILKLGNETEYIQKYNEYISYLEIIKNTSDVLCIANTHLKCSILLRKKHHLYSARQAIPSPIQKSIHNNDESSLSDAAEKSLLGSMYKDFIFEQVYNNIQEELSKLDIFDI